MGIVFNAKDWSTHLFLIINQFANVPKIILYFLTLRINLLPAKKKKI